MSVCDLCQIERCTQNKQCTYALFKKGIILDRFGQITIIDDNVSPAQARIKLEKPFIEKEVSSGRTKNRKGNNRSSAKARL